MRETNWGGNWVLFWWAGPCSVNFYPIFHRWWGCIPSPLFDLRPNYGEGIEDNSDLLQTVPCTHCWVSAPDPAAGHLRPHLCWRLLNTHSQVLVSLLWGHCSFVLGPNVNKVVSVSSNSLFPPSCLCSGGFMVGSVMTSSKKAYAIPRSAAPRAPTHVAGYYWPVPWQEALRHRFGSVAVWGLWALVCTRFVWALGVSLEGKGFDPKLDFTPRPILLGLLFCPRMSGIFIWRDPKFFSRESFSSKLQFRSSHRRRWPHAFLLCHLTPNEIPYDYTVEVTNRLKGLDLLERVLKNYEWRFMTFYKSQWSRLSPRKREKKKKAK